MCFVFQFYATITQFLVNVVWVLWGADKEETALESSDLSLHILHRSVGDEPPCYPTGGGNSFQSSAVAKKQLHYALPAFSLLCPQLVYF